MTEVKESKLENPEKEDFRIRVAKEKRERTRQRLLFAALELFLVSERTKPPVIEDVILKAGVSRGTFYKYFNSLEEVLTELGQRMAEEMISTYERLFSNLESSAARVIAGPILSLTHAGMQPGSIDFTSKIDFVDYLSRSNRVWGVITGSLMDAKKEGVLEFNSLSVATDFVIGSSVEGARRMQHEKSFNKEYMFEICAMVLKGFGLVGDKAEKAINEAWEQLNDHSSTLNWWRAV